MSSTEVRALRRMRSTGRRADVSRLPAGAAAVSAWWFENFGLECANSNKMITPNAEHYSVLVRPGGVVRARAVRLVTLCVLVVTAVLVGGGAAPSTTKSALQQRRLARGKYLVEGPAHCFGCHSEPDAAHGTDQPVAGRKGAGQVVPADLAQVVGIPPAFRVVCPNITPDRETGAGNWAEADFVRALRQGIGHDGRT